MVTAGNAVARKDRQSRHIAVSIASAAMTPRDETAVTSHEVEFAIIRGMDFSRDFFSIVTRHGWKLRG